MSRRIRAAVLSAALTVAGAVTASPVHACMSIGALVSPVGSALSTTHSVPVVESGELVIGVVGTEVHWTRRTTWLTYGARALLEGQVVTFDGALPDAEVTLYGRPVGGDWRPLATTRTDPDTGLFVFRPRPSRKTARRAEYGGGSALRVLLSRGDRDRQAEDHLGPDPQRRRHLHHARVNRAPVGGHDGAAAAQDLLELRVVDHSADHGDQRLDLAVLRRGAVAPRHLALPRLHPGRSVGTEARGMRPT